MAVVASVAINVDSRDAAAKLRQFQQQSTAAGRAAEQLQQGTTAAGQAAQGAGRQFQTAANGLKYYIDATGRARKENGQFVSTAEAAAAGLKLQARAGDEAGRSMSKLEGIMKQLGLAVGAAGVGRFAAGLTRTAATFEGELRKAAAIEGGGNFNQLRQDIERVAAAAAGTPTQVAALATSLSRAGFTAAETGQSLQGIVRGAEATGLSFEQMGSIVSDSMRSFGIETAKTESVVDILVKTANSSNQTVQDLGESLKYAAPIARSLGVNITDLSATMAILANNGIRGSEAGTALRTGLAKLQLAASASNGELLDLLSGNKQLADSMKALGVSVTDASGKLKPLDDVLINLKRGLEGLGPGVQAEVLQALFGEEAGGKLRAALNSTEEEIRKMFGTIREGAGAAAETQKEMQGFSYSMEVLGGNVEIVSNAIGDKFIAVLQPMVNGLNAALAEAQKLPKPLRDVAAGAAAVGIAVGGVTLAVKTLIPVVTTLAGLLGASSLAPLIAAGPWIALAAGIAAVVGAFASAAQEAERFNNVIASGTTEQLSQEMARLEKAIAAAESKTAGYQNELRGVGNQSGYASLEVQKLKDQLQQLQGTYNVRIQVEEIFTGGKGGKNVPQGYRLINGRLAYQVPGVGWVYADTGEPAQETTPPATPPRGGGGGAASAKRSGSSGADKAARAAEQLKQQTAQQLQAAKDLQFTQANQLLQLRAKNDFERAFVEFGIKRSEIERKYNELLQQSKSAEETKLLQQARAAEYKQSSLMLEQRSIELTKQASQPLDDILKNLQDQAAYQREYGELIKNGTNPELAKQIIEINRAYEASVAALEPAIAAAQAAVTKAQAEGASATEIEKYRKELERIQEIRGGLEGKRGQAIGAAKEGAAKQPTVLDGIGERIKQLQAELKPIKLATDSIVSGADAIGQAFGQAFQDVATGAKSTQEALADAFKGIGQSFISMAAEIIAKQMTLILLQTIFNALSGGLGGGSGSKSAVVQSKVVPVSQMPAGMAFAEGGYVTGPTNALIGEGGEPEYVIPFSKMDDAMANWADGKRGDAVLGSNSSRTSVTNNTSTLAIPFMKSTERLMAERSERETVAAINNPKPLDVRFESQVINGVEYVTAEQHRRGMAQAAEQGRTLALSALQNSVKTRKRVGMA